MMIAARDGTRSFQVHDAVRSWEALDDRPVDCARFVAHVVTELTGQTFESHLRYMPLEAAYASLSTIIDKVTLGMGAKARTGQAAIGSVVAWKVGGKRFGLGIQLAGGVLAVLNDGGDLVGIPDRTAVCWWLVPWVE